MTVVASERESGFFLIKYLWTCLTQLENGSTQLSIGLVTIEPVLRPIVFVVQSVPASTDVVVIGVVVQAGRQVFSFLLLQLLVRRRRRFRPLDRRYTSGIGSLQSVQSSFFFFNCNCRRRSQAVQFT